MPKNGTYRSLPLGAQAAKLSEDTLAKKKEGWYPTGLPLVNFSSDDGFGYGVRGYVYYNGSKDDPYFDSTPYFMQLYAQFFATTGGANPEPINLVTILGLALFVLGSYLNTASEYMRHVWKRRPENAGKLYTGGLFRYARHINYFGDDLLGTGFALVGIGIDPRRSMMPDDLATWQRLEARFVTIYPFGGRPQGDAARARPEGLVEVEDVSGQLLAWLRSRGHGIGHVGIVRPDRFVFGAVEAGELPHVTRRLAA